MAGARTARRGFPGLLLAGFVAGSLDATPAHVRVAERAFRGDSEAALKFEIRGSATGTGARHLCNRDRRDRRGRIELLDPHGERIDSQDVGDYEAGLWLIYGVRDRGTLRFVSGGEVNLALFGVFLV